ncbi:hypothetical protein EWF20_06225 [Sulfolobus sp. S-194]|uniref:hypothetical protein n=1 Tax=Sulfolobus sp. S-194 TaxID=2512240 RepID=UPI001436F818|nr:hypothetical protein [Sulfolobus sp. S-194]QIW23790.1 hypothetical protein EWF20_06225 [Sulfolobus sp. S-194]
MPIPLITIDIVLEDIKEELKKRGKNVPNVSVSLVDYLPDTVLAYVKAGEYTIYVNRQQYLRAKRAGYEYEYLFVILLHEYLHLIGIADEREVRRIDMEIVEEKFGKESLAYKLAIGLADPRDIREPGLRPHTYI